MRDPLAAIRRDQVPVVHPTVPLPLVAHLQLLRHRQDHLVQNQVVQIANDAVKICQHVAVHPIAEVQLVRYRKGVKPVIHAGFVPSR